MSRKTRKPASGVAVESREVGPAIFRKPAWLFAAALAAAVIVFGPALRGAFVFDDIHLPFANPGAAGMPAAFWIGGVRPVLMLTYWINFLVSGTSPFLYHVVNLILHAATALLVFKVFERLLSISDTVPNPGPNALAGAAIFLLHPLQTESVDYIAGRAEILSGLFFCAAWLVFLKYFDRPTSVVVSLTILLLAGTAVLAKESAICLPAILIVTDIFWSGQPIDLQLRRRMNLYLPFLCGALLASAAILRSLSGGTGAGFSAGIAPSQYALTECRVILTYIRLFFFPAGQNGDWHLPVFHSFTDSFAWLYVLALAGLMILIVFLRSRVRLASYGLLIFLLMLAPTSSVVPVVDVLAERRMYMPIAGLILAAIGILVRLRLSPATLRAVAIASVLIAALLSWNRSAVWASPEVFWGDSAQKNPLNPRAHFGLGTSLLARHDCVAAVKELAIARSQDPSKTDIQWNLGQAYQCNGQLELALIQYRAVADTRPSADAWNQIAYNEARLGHSDEVFAALADAMRLDPDNAVSWAYRGLARMTTSNSKDAQADFERALQLDPQNQVALDGLRRLNGLRGR